MKKRRKFALAVAVLLALAVWCGWYARPVSLFELNPDLVPASVHVSIIQYGEGYEDPAHLSFDIDAGTPQGQALLADLEAIVLRRSFWNPLRSFYWKHLTAVFPPTITGRQTEPGQYQYMIFAAGSSDWISLQFNLDEWEYDLPEQPSYFPCRISDGIPLGQSLGDKLWEMAQQSDSDS